MEEYGDFGNGNGQFGTGTTKTMKTPAKMLDTDGNQLVGVKQLQAGRIHVVVLKEDGTVWSTGYNNYGQLGDGTTTNRTTITRVKKSDGTYIENASKIYAIYDSTYILVSGEKGIYATGYNSEGQLLNKNTTNLTYATKVQEDKDILTIGGTTGNYSTIFADIDGFVYACGNNYYGQLGNETTINTIIPECISNSRIEPDKNIINIAKVDNKEKITYKFNVGFNLLKDEMQNEQCTYKSLDENIVTVDEEGVVTAKEVGTTYVVLYNENNNLYSSVKVNVNIQESNNRTTPKVEGGSDHFIALSANGTVYTWGYNNNGQLGLGNNTTTKEPTIPKARITLPDGTTTTDEILDAIDVAAGYTHTLILREDGTVWAAGDNTKGACGSDVTSTLFCKVKINSNQYLQNIIAVAAGSQTSYALSKDGTVYSWGNNNNGQLGINTTSSDTYAYPNKVQKMNNVMQISAGNAHLVMLKTDGTAWAVGLNGSGQLGINNTRNKRIATQMLDVDGNALTNVKEVSAGGTNTVILKQDGTVWSVGYNYYGQLGIGNTSTSESFKQVLESASQPVENARHISMGKNQSGYITLGKDTDGNSNGMYVMGYNNAGQLFTESTGNKTYATKVQTSKDILYATGNSAGIIVDTTGKIYTVGNNSYGQLGNSQTTNSVKPICLTHEQLEVRPNIVNYTTIGESTEKISTNILCVYNLLIDKDTNVKNSFTSRNSKIATVSDDGVITAQGYGTTTIKVYNEDSNMYGAVRVNVKGEGNFADAKISGGENYFIALKSNGTVYAWGNNSYGQLGTKNNSNQTEPVKPVALITYEDGTTEYEEITDAIDVKAGYNHALVLREDGTVWAAGNNAYGQLGNGNTTNSNVYTKVKLNDNGDYLENIVEISAGYYTSYAVTAEGEVYAWGRNTYGNLGQGTTDSNAHSNPVKMIGIKGIVQIEAEYEYVSMLDVSGSVWGLGYGYGQFGVGNNTSMSKPVQMLDENGSTLHGVIEIAGGRNFVIVLKEDGTVWGTGNNSYGQLGNGSTSTITKIKQVKAKINNEVVELKDAKHIYAAGDSVYITRNEDELGNAQGMYVVGRGANGQLFNKETSNKTYATPVEGYKEILTVTATTSNGSQTGALVDENGKVFTVGYNGNGEIGNGITESSTSPICISKGTIDATPKIISYKQVGDTGEKVEYKIYPGFNLIKDEINYSDCEFSSLDENIATVSSDGIVTASGIGKTFIKVHNEEANADALVRVNVTGSENATFPTIVGGSNHFVALKANGEVWAWGSNTNGQLGIGNNTNQIKPIKTNIYDAQNNDGVHIIDVAAGNSYTVVLKADGTVWSTGYNFYGQLGNGTRTDSNNFVQVKLNENEYLNNIVQISSYNNTTYALTADGEVYGWGYNGYGQLGNGETESVNVYPIKMKKIENIIQVDAGENFALMLDVNSSVWGTGYNGYGQLATNNTTTYYIPQQMKDTNGSNTLYGVKQVSAGTIHSIILKQDGTVYSAGYNGNGQLGTNNTSSYSKLQTVKYSNGNVLTGVKNILASGYMSMFELEEKGIYVAGYNNYGQLFTNDKVNKTTATLVQDDKNIILMAATSNISNQTTAIVDNTGMVYTAGYNGNGERGNDSTITLVNPSNISNNMLDVGSRRVILNLNSINNTKQINAKTNLGFNLLFNSIENENISYKSLDEEIALVSDAGLITANKYGTTTVEVAADAIPGKTIITVEVINENDVTIPKITAGKDSIVALKADGTVWTWGYNGYGQLGTGDKTNRYKPTQININNIIDIAEGDGYTLLLSKEGEVYSFGTNGNNQLGRSGNTTEVEKISELKDIIQISASTYNAMALDKDGKVYSWGYNSNGQLGIGNTANKSVPIKLQLNNIIKIAGNNQTSSAIDSSGNLYVWGYNGYGQFGNGTTNTSTEPVLVKSLSNVIDVALEENTIIALDKDGNVYAAGYNGYGNLGNNTTSTRYTFDKVIERFETITNTEDGTTTIETVYLTNVKIIKTTSRTAVAIKNDGTAYAWGYNGYGQLANGNTNNVLTATQIKYGKDKDVINEIFDIALAENTIIVVRQDGKVWSNGRNNYGQIGDSSVADRKEFICISKSRVAFSEAPIKIKGINIQKEIKTQMLAGFNLLYNEIENAEFEYTVKNTEIAKINTEGKLESIKKGKTQLTATEKTTGSHNSVDVYVLDNEDLTFPQIETYSNSTIALRANGEVWSYGNNSYGQLGTGDTYHKYLPTYTGINNIIQTAAGENFTLVLDKEGYVWSFGYNVQGQLGNGNTRSTAEKQQVKSSDGKGYLENIVAISAGKYHAMALDKNGDVWTWGYNGYGQLGIGSSDNSYLPKKVDSLENIIKIEAGYYSSYAIDNNNNFWVAGYNGNGELGDGTTTTKYTFVKNELISDVAEVSSNNNYSTIVLLLDGSVWGFGYNGNNVLTNVSGAIPQPLGTENGVLTNVTAISLGYRTGYAITDDEKLLVWGLNNYGQLSTGNTDTQSFPTYAKDENGEDLTNVMLVAGGEYYTQIVKNDGTVWSIGYNGYGQCR